MLGPCVLVYLLAGLMIFAVGAKYNWRAVSWSKLVVMCPIMVLLWLPLIVVYLFTRDRR